MVGVAELAREQVAAVIASARLHATSCCGPGSRGRATCTRSRFRRTTPRLPPEGLGVGDRAARLAGHGVDHARCHGAEVIDQLPTQACRHVVVGEPKLVERTERRPETLPAGRALPARPGQRADWSRLPLLSAPSRARRVNGAAGVRRVTTGGCLPGGSRRSALDAHGQATVRAAQSAPPVGAARSE